MGPAFLGMFRGSARLCWGTTALHFVKVSWTAEPSSVLGTLCAGCLSHLTAVMAAGCKALSGLKLRSSAVGFCKLSRGRCVCVVMSEQAKGRLEQHLIG